MNPIDTLPIHRYHAGCLDATTDQLAAECPIALVYNGISHAVLMATPQDVSEWALGFSFSEGIVQHLHEVYDLTVESTDRGLLVNMEIASSRLAVLKQRRRQLIGRTGCGLCGIDSLAAALPNIQAVERKQIFQTKDLESALNAFRQHQPWREQTGSLHGAAWVQDGQIQAAFEDVGRHNALDKVLGYLVNNQIDRQSGFVLISSRASYEMVAKTAVLGVGMLVAVSAATALAVKMAEQLNMTLLGFAKPQQWIIYTHPQWIAASGKTES